MTADAAMAMVAKMAHVARAYLAESQYRAFALDLQVELGLTPGRRNPLEDS